MNPYADTIELLKQEIQECQKRIARLNADGVIETYFIQQLEQGLPLAGDGVFMYQGLTTTQDKLNYSRGTLEELRLKITDYQRKIANYEAAIQVLSNERQLFKI